MSDRPRLPLPLPAPAAPGVWYAPIEAVDWEADGVSAVARLNLMCMSWAPRPAPAPDWPALLPAVREMLASSPPWHRYRQAVLDVAGAKRAVALGARDVQAADLAGTTARLELRGADLATRLAEIDRERAATQARLNDLRQGLAYLTRDLHAARGPAESAVRSAALRVAGAAVRTPRTREAVMAEIGRVLGPLLDELGSWRPGTDCEGLVQAAGAALLVDEPPEG